VASRSAVHYRGRERRLGKRFSVEVADVSPDAHEQAHSNDFLRFGPRQSPSAPPRIGQDAASASTHGHTPPIPPHAAGTPTHHHSSASWHPTTSVLKSIVSEAAAYNIRLERTVAKSHYSPSSTSSLCAASSRHLQSDPKTPGQKP